MMKRRKQLSLVLAFCMVFSTFFAGIPVNAAWDEEAETFYGLVATEWLDTVDDAEKEKLVTTEDGFPGTYVWDDEGDPVYDEDGKQKVEAIAYTDSWIGASIRGSRYWFDYKETADAEPVHLMAKDLKVKYYLDDQGPWNEEAEVVEKTGLLKDDPDQENWKGCVDFFPDEMGNYAFSYTKNGEEELFMVRVSWPEIGFYSAQERSEDTLLLDEFSRNYAYYRVLKGEGTKKEIYLKLKDDEGQKVILAGDAGDRNVDEVSSFELEPYGGPAINGDGDLEGYMEVEDLGDGCYKLTFADEIIVPADPEDEESESWVTNGFNLHINAVAIDTQWDEDSEEWVEDENSEFYYIDAWFNCEYLDPGLYAQVEGNSYIYTENKESMAFTVTPEKHRISFGKLSSSNDGTVKMQKLTKKELDNLTVQKAVDFDDYGNVVEWEEATAGEDYDCTPDGDYMVFESYYQHEYRISADGIPGCVYLHAYLPGLGFYSTNTRPENEKIENRIVEVTVDEAKSDTVYVLGWKNSEEDWAINPETVEIKAVADSKDVTDTYIKVDKTPIDEDIFFGYGITITDAAAEDFKIIVTAETNNGEQDYGELLVNVNSIKELAIVTPPTKTVYDEGDSFNAAGMVVNAVYEDGTKKAITGYEVSAKKALTASDKTVTISYRGKNVTQAITVNPKKTATPAPEPLATGKSVTDSKTGNVYKVTKSDKKNPTVEYTAPKKGAKNTVTVPDTVTIDGVKYSVTTISANAFKNNKKITKIVVGKNIAGIGKNAFSGCKKLKTITIKTTKLTSKNVKKDAFKGIPKKTVIQVPKKSLKSYKKLFPKKGLNKKNKIKK